MKIRLFGDSIRLRLTQKEVGILSAGGGIESVIPFPGEALGCSVQASLGAFEAHHAAGRITVLVPRAEATKWASSEDEGMYMNSGVLHIAVEKDYNCVHKPDSPDNAGTFPHPLGAQNNIG